jgi:hypothetical protein
VGDLSPKSPSRLGKGTLIGRIIVGWVEGGPGECELYDPFTRNPTIDIGCIKFHKRAHRAGADTD